MRRTTTIWIAIGVATVLFLPAWAGAGSGKAAERAEKAAQLMLAPDPTDAQMKEGLLLLLDAVAEAASDARVPAGFTAKIAEARRRMSEVSLVDEKAVSLLNACYTEIHGGTPFRMPETVRTPADAVGLIRERLGSVRGLLSQGKPDEAVRRMLEALLAVTTPMEAPM